MVDATGTTTWSYDAVSRVTSVAAPGGTVSYSYNDAGQRATMTLPGSRVVSYAYTTGGVLESVTDWDNRAIELDVNLAGQRTAIERPNGVTTSYAYDGAGRLTGITHADSGGTLMSHGYTLDANGNRTSVSGPGGTDTYTYDAVNRVTEVIYGGSNTVEYTYDPQGNRLTQVQNSVTTHSYSYDDADQLTSDGTLSFTYDAAGNLLTAGSDSFSWTWDQRLASATVNSVTTTYAIDGLGVRVATTTGLTTTDLVWDRLAELPLLVDDGTMAYLHADGLLAEVDGNDDVLYHLTDGLGSVRGLTDDGGDLVGTAAYEAFGGVRSASGSSSAFGFTGELTDPTTGLVHLRARDYNTATGRFVSMDTVQPNAPGTQGYNRCAYVANNPATWTDPSGKSLEQFACMTAISIAISRMFKFSLFALARGVLTGQHRHGAYVVVISAAFVGAGAAAEALLGDTSAVGAGEAIAGGLLLANGLAVSVWAFGTSHMSIVAATSILLAGVLLLLLGAILQQLAELVAFASFLWRSFSPHGAICSYLERHGELPDFPSFRGIQSGWLLEGDGISIDASSLPITPRISRP